ncbi:MAG: CHRD domain-containing protein [Gammaproteobacteria bacterium]
MAIKPTRAACALLTLGASSLAATPVVAAHLSTYTVNIVELNDSGMNGTGILTLDTDANTLAVDFAISGVETGVDHGMHIHGRFDGSGNPMQSVVPTPSDDADGDGYVEVLEGLPQYGDILLPFLPQSTDNGVIEYVDIFDLNDSDTLMSPVSGENYDIADLLPLNLREFVIHGMSVPGGVGAGTEGEVDGTAGYKALLPIGAGEIAPSPVPLPAPLALLAVAAAPLLARRRLRG